MIGEIYKSDRFREDVKKYNESIRNLDESTEKEEAKRLLSDLVFEVKKMDNMYMDMVYNHQLGSMGNEFREKILNIRKKLDEVITKRSKTKT